LLGTFAVRQKFITGTTIVETKSSEVEIIEKVKLENISEQYAVINIWGESESDLLVHSQNIINLSMPSSSELIPSSSLLNENYQLKFYRYFEVLGLSPRHSPTYSIFSDNSNSIFSTSYIHNMPFAQLPPSGYDSSRPPTYFICCPNLKSSAFDANNSIIRQNEYIWNLYFKKLHFLNEESTLLRKLTNSKLELTNRKPEYFTTYPNSCRLKEVSLQELNLKFNELFERSENLLRDRIAERDKLTIIIKNSQKLTSGGKMVNNNNNNSVAEKMVDITEKIYTLKPGSYKLSKVIQTRELVVKKIDICLDSYVQYQRIKPFLTDHILSNDELKQLALTYKFKISPDGNNNFTMTNYAAFFNKLNNLIVTNEKLKLAGVDTLNPFQLLRMSQFHIVDAHQINYIAGRPLIQSYIKDFGLNQIDSEIILTNEQVREISVVTSKCFKAFIGS